jgi:hypothetical protein
MYNTNLYLIFYTTADRLVLKNWFLYKKTFLESCLSQEELLRTQYEYSIGKKTTFGGLEEIKKIT